MTKNNNTSLNSWLELCRSISAKREEQYCYATIVDYYSQPVRKYHTLNHISHCLNELDEHFSAHQNIAAIKTAVWFHDIVYVPNSAVNEEFSAAFAQSCLTRIGVQSAFIANIQRLIFATRLGFKLPLVDSGEAVVVDVDLSILGQPPEVFDIYEKNVRLEYKHVSEATFWSARTKILKLFLKKKHIFNTQVFTDLYEHAARENIARSVKAAIARR